MGLSRKPVSTDTTIPFASAADASGLLARCPSAEEFSAHRSFEENFAYTRLGGLKGAWLDYSLGADGLYHASSTKGTMTTPAGAKTNEEGLETLRDFLYTYSQG
jgi:hypothetical protein